MGSNGGAARAVLLGGLVAGTIDIGAACLITGLGPLVILRYISGGLLGRASLKGGWPEAALGLGLQWAMAILIAAVYVAASRRAPIVNRLWVAAGLAYGAIVFVVMNWVVVPLSALHATPHFAMRGLVLNLSAMLLFGLIIAFFASRGDGEGSAHSDVPR